jgi:hypothetical protein
LSFVEKNKTWLLPLLGLGVAGVLYLNLHTAGPGPVQAPAPALPAAPMIAPAPPASLQPATGAAGGLWNDLIALAKPPERLSQEAGLRERCRSNLAEFLEAPKAAQLPRPGWVREAEPVKVPAPPAPPAQAAASGTQAPPVVEFILTGPEGAAAWIQGHAYHAGDTLAGGKYVVTSIAWNQVGLKGPKGTVLVQVMNRYPQPLAGTRPSAEAP